MSEEQKSRFRILKLGRGPTLLLLGTLLLLLATGGGVGASVLEENDEFCTTCHLAPERTYYNRAQFAMDHQEEEIPDLATLHYVEALNNVNYDEFRCVDCHRGRQRVTDRAAALALGAYDGLVYLTGGGSTIDVESGEVHQRWIVNTSCEGCHEDALLVLGFDNHFHNYLPAAEDANERTGDLFVPEGTAFEDEQKLLDDGLQTHETEVDCLTCHRSHVQVIGGEQVQFIEEEVKLRGCTDCHEDNDLEIDLLEES